MLKYSMHHIYIYLSSLFFLFKKIIPTYVLSSTE